jgi:hypothetical protein
MGSRLLCEHCGSLCGLYGKKNGSYALKIFYRKAPHVGTKFKKGMSYTERVRGSFVNIAAPFAASVVKNSSHALMFFYPNGLQKWRNTNREQFLGIWPQEITRAHVPRTP